jgi:regulator of protease activity HflC (stomatin/prohibitin superfamily)
MVEVRDVELPDTMQRAMAAQAEAERERRAKIVHADGEFQAAQKLADAAQVIATQPSALQLRYLQTLTTISTERTNTIVFPMPIDLVKPILDATSKDKK